MLQVDPLVHDGTAVNLIDWPLAMEEEREEGTRGEEARCLWAIAGDRGREGEREREGGFLLAL